MKLKSDSRIGDFIKKKKPLGMLFVAVLGAALIFFSSRSEAQSPKDAQPYGLDEICSSVDGVGRCQTVINYGEEGEVYAVAILCEGAESVRVRSELYSLISRLYGIGYNRISVLKISK